MTPSISNKPYAGADTDGLAFCIKEVDNLAADLSTTDVYARGPEKMILNWKDLNPSEPVRNSAKKVIRTKTLEQDIGLEIEIDQIDKETEDFIKNAKGKFYSIVNFEESYYDNSLERNVQLVRFLPLCTLAPSFSKGQPDGEKPKLVFTPLPNPNAAAVALTNAGTIAGLSDMDTLNSLEPTETQGWDVTTISVASGESYETAEVRKLEDS